MNKNFWSTKERMFSMKEVYYCYHLRSLDYVFLEIIFWTFLHNNMLVTTVNCQYYHIIFVL